MVATIKSKKNLMKTGAPMRVNADGVVVLNPTDPTPTYAIDVLANDVQVCHFTSVIAGADVSYTTLYAAAHIASPSMFP